MGLVLYTLYNFAENTEYYLPLRLAVSGTAGTGKSYVIKCLQRLVRQVFEANDAIQVITPTGNAAYLVQGSTAHSFLGVPTGGRPRNELTVPMGPLLEKIQKKCKNLKVLVGDERSMIGCTTMAGWNSMHVLQLTKEPMQISYGEGFLWQCLWEMMFSFPLCVTHPCTSQIVIVHHLTTVAWFGQCLIALLSLLR